MTEDAGRIAPEGFRPTITDWRLLFSGPMTGPENMACDEALLDGVVQALATGGTPTVTLRLYAWEPPAVSLGFHQDERKLDLARLEREGIPVVRRATGGRAIYHADELTYAVVGPLSLFGRECSVMEAYRALSGPILYGLGQRLGVAAALASGRRAEHPRHAGSVACFQSPAACDAVARGKKVVGSAQVRRGGAFLQHGSLPLVPREERERRVLLGAGAAKIDALGSLEEAAGRAVTWQEAAEALVLGYRMDAGVRFREGELSASERKVLLSRVQKVTVPSHEGAASGAGRDKAFSG
jgi:lipoyl(octanoyl) transferase